MTKITIHGRDFISLGDFTPQELQTIVDIALRLKKKPSFPIKRLQGKNIAMIFQTPSTRTRLSFEVAIRTLGSHPIFMNWGDIQLQRGETLADTGRVLSRYVDALIVRSLNHSDIETLAEWCSIPVINSLSDVHHPCQALSDILTLYERKRNLRKVKLAWVGDGNNVCHSLLLASAKFGLHMTAASPREYQPKPSILEEAQSIAAKTGGKIQVFENPEEAVRDADAVYTDTFVSMGYEKEYERRMKAFGGKYQVTRRLLEYASPDVVFMHCLPAHRGQEVEAEVIDGSSSIVWEQAENRLHLQRGLLAALI